MRIKMWQLSLVVVFGLCGAGCGPDDRGGGGNGSGSFDVDKLQRACAVLHSCFAGWDYPAIGGCIGEFARYGTEQQVDCVVAASVANCTAAEACIGQKLEPDTTSCVDQCLDDHTLVRCTGGAMHFELDCPTYLRSTGPQCVVGTGGAVACGVACSMAGSTCDGAILHRCASGIESAIDCARIASECDSTNPQGCVLPLSNGVCTTLGCQGDLLCDANGRVDDCRQLLPDGTCTIITNNINGCGWASDCDITTYADFCIGTTLRSCVLGVVKDIDCTKIGGTQCVPNPNTSGAWCSL